MKTILFLLTSGRMRAFVGPPDVQQLRYRGKEDMPCANAADLQTFVQYMTGEFADGPEQGVRLCFVCDTVKASRHVMEMLGEGNYPLFSLSSLDNCLSLLLEGQGIDDCWLRFEDTVWHMANGMARRESGNGKCPFTLTHVQFALTFFHEEQRSAHTREDKQPQKSPQRSAELHPLGRVIESSRVRPRHD